ncbi:S24 family peptidase [Aliamphritea hakodatensis]|uniref:S24 family peptidase n=1 Tax=Aliamphritea hakodatensis TaxID=2895352 RepID=UPI0022FD514E|nr:S24 family peptidase [Aliamphritea hakodatensis]
MTDSTSTRITKRREEQGLNMSELARRLGVTPQSVQQWEAGRNSPRGKRLEALAQILNCSKEWLMFGTSEPESGAPANFIKIPVFDVELAAGAGRHIDMEEVSDWVPIDQDWIYQNGLSPDHLSVVYVKGDSMTPKLEDGDMLLVNTAERRPVSGKIYAIAVENELRVKRLMQRMDGNWLITSDNKNNPEYQDEVIAPYNFENLRIIGQAVKVLMGSL